MSGRSPDPVHVVVTGASQGLGEAIALAFARRYGVGAQLALAARSESKLRRVAEACRALGAEAEGWVCDVTDEVAVDRLAREALGRWGAPHVLVNNAGAFVSSPFAETSPALFREQIEVNLTSAFLVTRAFLPAMQARGRGDLFFMASVASVRGYAGGAAYGAAKHGLLGLARTLREETRASGLRVMTLLPGATRTPSWDGTGLPDARFISPGDVASTLLGAHLLSDRAVVEEVLIRPQEGDV